MHKKTNVVCLLVSYYVQVQKITRLPLTVGFLMMFNVSAGYKHREIAREKRKTYIYIYTYIDDIHTTNKSKERKVLYSFFLLEILLINRNKKMCVFVVILPLCIRLCSKTKVGTKKDKSEV